ncbi:MAG: LCP family protein [Lachnospiraceae bacterium]|nr:LCP family protein [Lachnospiraceae bacterium]
MEKKKKSLIETIVLAVAAVVAVAAALLLFVLYTKPGKKLTSKVVAGYLHNSVNFVSGQSSEKAQGNTPGNLEEVLFEKPEEAEPVPEKEREFYHILLLGEEALKTSPGKGRTDTIILATIHVREKKVVLTSVLRDTYVEPEGMKPCKINAVYARQGVSGLYKLLYDKLGIWPDGYVKVGFDSFEEIINLLGGAEVTLTAEEAEYLNTHNYISKEQFRNVTPGTQVLNGNQTLGYCRVRYVANCNGTKNDYGRTERQRMVLQNLFERYKESGLTGWIKILKQALGYIETDISEETMEELIYVVYDGRITTMEQQQLPMKGAFSSKDMGKVTSTLVADWEKNKALFWESLK